MRWLRNRRRPKATRLIPLTRLLTASRKSGPACCGAGSTREDDRRRIFGRPLSIGAHFEIEAPALRPLPAVPFDPSLLLRPRVDTGLEQGIASWRPACRTCGVSGCVRLPGMSCPAVGR